MLFVGTLVVLFIIYLVYKNYIMIKSGEMKRLDDLGKKRRIENIGILQKLVS